MIQRYLARFYASAFLRGNVAGCYDEIEIVFHSVHLCFCYIIAHVWTIQVLLNAVVGGGVCGSAQISVTKVYSSALLALRGGGGVKFPDKKHYVTLE